LTGGHEHESQMNIAYYFDFDYASGLSADGCARDAVELGILALSPS
jgi:hypothetical protein